MKFTADARELAAALATASRAVSTRNSIAVLGGVLLETWAKTLRITGTDMQVAMRVTLPLPKAAKKGSVVVAPVKDLITGIKTLDGPVTLTFDKAERELVVVCGTTTLRYRTIPPEDFPSLPVPDTQVAAIEHGVYVDAFASVARAYSRDESRPVLTGVLHEFGKRKLALVATDSYRLAWRTVTCTKATKELVIIPSHLCELAAKLLSGYVTVSTGDMYVFFESDNLQIFGRRIDGKFPTWRELIPEGNEGELTVDRQATLKSAERIHKLARRGVPARVCMNGTPRLILRQQGGPSVEEQIEGTFKGRSEVEFGVNPEFLVDALKSFETETVVLRVISALRPFVIGDLERGYLLMPVRLSS